MEILILVLPVAFLGWVYYLYSNRESIKQDNIFKQQQIDSLDERIQKILGDFKSQSKLEKHIKSLEQRITVLNSLCEKPLKTFPWVAKVYADFISAVDKSAGNHLLARYNAYKSKEVIDSLAKDKALLNAQLKEALYKLEYYSYYATLIDQEKGKIDFDRINSELSKIKEQITILQPESERLERLISQKRLSLDALETAEKDMSEKVRINCEKDKAFIQASYKYKMENLAQKYKEVQSKYALLIALRTRKLWLNVESQMIKKSQELKRLSQDIDIQFPWYAKIYSDLDSKRDEEAIDYLVRKKNPAIKASQRISELKKEKRLWALKAKEFEYKLLYYQTVVPAIEELDEPISADDFSADVSKPENWLSQSEYTSLTPRERCQRALDNYLNSHKKSKRQIGRDYERYVGWIYENQGYRVEYKGILAGLEDLGRDLICRKGNETIIVQCKYWSKEKLIHEKHINQLFGTYVHYVISCFQDSEQACIFDAFDLARDTNCKAAFWTHTKLSYTAAAFAKALKIEVHEEEGIKPYPIIKCNINRTTGERIFHLPFDINYDVTIIEPEKEECYATTVKEAEDKGFKHAMKWSGQKP